MVDTFLLSLKEISQTLLPVAGLVALIFLAMVLYRIYKVLTAMPETLEKVNDLLESSNHSLEQLDRPLEALGNVSDSVDTVNKVTLDAVKSLAAYTVENSDVIVKWFKKEPKEDVKENSKERDKEDFGIYD